MKHSLRKTLAAGALALIACSASWAAAPLPQSGKGMTYYTTAVADEAGRQAIDGVELAALAQELADKALDQLDGGTGSRSARNHLTGLITRVVSDTVMSQVELQCGRYRIVSLISTEAVQELGLEPGVVATAVIKATNVTIEMNRA